MSIQVGGGLAGIVDQGLDNLDKATQAMQKKMDEISNMESEDQTAAMLEMQFAVGQYNTMVELTSNITKTLSDSLKTVSQKL